MTDKVQIKEATDEDRIKILQNEEFMRFFSRNTRILEKALDQDDIFFDYGGLDKHKEYAIANLSSNNLNNLCLF